MGVTIKGAKVTLQHKTEVFKNAYDPNAKIDKQLFFKMTQQGTPADLMSKIQNTLGHKRGLVSDAKGKASFVEKKSQLRDVELEAEIAVYFGNDLKKISAEYLDEKNKRIVETDVETDDFMIEVTTVKKDKSSQIGKYVDINSQQKNIILYAPNYNLTAGKDIAKTHGVQVAKNKEELFDLCKKLRLE